MSQYSVKDTEFKNRFLYEKSFLSDTQSEKKDSLINGTYDEREAHDSFQQALLEWRNVKSNSARNNNKNNNNNKMEQNERAETVAKDAIIGTDDATQTKIPKVSIKELEEQIHKNHSLSYAERMLVLKHRRNDLQLTPETQTIPNKTKTQKSKNWESLELGNKKSFLLDHFIAYDLKHLLKKTYTKDVVSMINLL